VPPVPSRRKTAGVRAMEDCTRWLHGLWQHAQNGVMWLWSSVSGLLLYLAGGPSAALSALFIVMIVDLICRLVAESIHAGGFFVAIKSRHIRSKAMFRGTALKFFGYYVLAVVAYQLKRVTPIPQVSDMLSAVIYMFLLIVEGISVFENLSEAGLTSLQPLKRRFEREMEKLEHGDDGPAASPKDQGPYIDP
jgi:phage-related holin